MDEDQERKHVCRFCGKRFPCGKSLGGHMRTHMSAMSVGTHDGPSRTKHKSSVKDSDHSGYGLRENPKKTCRLSDSYDRRTSSGQFHSSKSSHARSKSRSGKGKMSVIFQEDSDRDNPSEDEMESAFNWGRRSKRRIDDSSAQEASSSRNNGSPCFTETEHEQAQTAMSLLMLSKDRAHWVGPNYVAESSNSSMDRSRSPPFGTPSSHECKTDQLSETKGINSRYRITDPDRRTEVSDSEHSSFSEPSIKIKTTRKCHGTYGSKSENRNASEAEPANHFLRETEDSEMSAAAAMIGTWNENNMFHGEHNAKPETRRISNVRNKYTCITCSKSFDSYQALGGHRASHRKNEGCECSAMESDLEGRKAVAELRKNSCSLGTTKTDGRKTTSSHECPVCFKNFASGQALGGHKRTHLVGNTSAHIGNIPAAIQQVGRVRDMLDLNLPAPTDDY